MKRKSASKKLLPLMLILMLILGISMPANVVEVKDTSQNIYNVVQNSDGTYTITVKDGNAYKNLETGKVVLFSAKEMGTDTDIALKVQNITKVKLSGSVAVTIPDVSCKLDAGFSWGKIEVKHFIASVTGKADFEGGLYISGVNSEQQIKHASGTMETVSDVLELGRVPIKLGTTGLSADLVVSLFYDVSGQFVVKYSVEAIGGYELYRLTGKDTCGMYLTMMCSQTSLCQSIPLYMIMKCRKQMQWKIIQALFQKQKLLRSSETVKRKLKKRAARN